MTDPAHIDQPGVYDLPAHVYHADPVVGGSLSSSGAQRLLPPFCPAKYKAWRAAGGEHRHVFDVGRAAHALVLGVGEPFEVIDADSYHTKAARAQRDEAYAEGRTPLLSHEHEQVQAMAAALRKVPLARALFRPGTGRPEQTLVWRDGETGVWRRAMLDWLPHSQSGKRLLITDYKTAASVEPAAISNALARYGYYQQASWYIDGATALDLHGGVEPAFIFVVQEKEPPYLVTVAQIDPESIEWGRRRNRKAMHIYRRCIETGVWPGYADDEVISVGLPRWSVYEHEAAYAAGEYDTEQDIA
ncbi:PD-(D/E)XK nuclease-like domain-containing protein [Pseudonocardia asaccharolytica]|uniref:Putative exodeoxyribonuclease 8 PDDEXK-like domain-containing protein n=1 Tax=Pseudonocardia asaccharolytica DSM 44247 = NBRC 16224 TaxID=1123024 RepID=A0A511D8N4_9PSEU|nr:PD-(D/E)XK nuclease-like domain-containing protein [Pseudonocardia asaccharolytica]GEL19298.1 hypothetical protein PA7_31350 [Pseudonocardia asaccharolytica DSM 44247 = NBRC 16224]